MMQIEKLILISLACAFLSNVITTQNGPMFVFSAFRMQVSTWASKLILSNGTKINSGELSDFGVKRFLLLSKFVKSIGELVTCPYCLSVWFVLIFIIIGFDGNLVTLWLAGSGLTYVWLGLLNGRS